MTYWRTADMNLTEGLWITNPLKIFSGASDRTTEDWQDPSRTLGRMRSYHYLKALSNQHSFYLCFLAFSTACSHTGFPSSTSHQVPSHITPCSWVQTLVTEQVTQQPWPKEIPQVTHTALRAVLHYQQQHQLYLRPQPAPTGLYGHLCCPTSFLDVHHLAHHNVLNHPVNWHPYTLAERGREKQGKWY